MPSRARRRQFRLLGGKLVRQGLGFGRLTLGFRGFLRVVGLLLLVSFLFLVGLFLVLGVGFLFGLFLLRFLGGPLTLKRNKEVLCSTVCPDRSAWDPTQRLLPLVLLHLVSTEPFP